MKSDWFCSESEKLDMKMNIFEGARRIVKIIAGLWLLGCVGYAFTINPYVSVTYVVSAPHQSPSLMTTTCPDSAARETNWDYKTKKGNEVAVTLCFLSSLDFIGAKTPLIPYVAADGKIYGNEKYAPGVVSYAKEVMKNFELPAQEQATLDAKAREKWWSAVWMNVQILIAGLIFIFGFAWCVGYVVRGFMGVPRGSDVRPEVEGKNDK